MFKRNLLKTVYTSKNISKLPLRHTANFASRTEDYSNIVTGKALSNEKINNKKRKSKEIENTISVVRERPCPIIRSEFSYDAKHSRDFKIKAFSPSPEIIRQNSPNLVYLVLDREEKVKRHTVKLRKFVNSKERISTSPRLNFTEIKPDLPGNDGNRVMVHKYALPQALVPIHSPMHRTRVHNILEDNVNPNPVPFCKRGMSGWKISIKKYYKRKLKQLEDTFYEY